MKKFNVGDKVVCTDSGITTNSLVVGQTYTVTKVDGDLVYVDNGKFGWLFFRFKLDDSMDHLYDNEKPLGLLSKKEQDHLKKKRLSLEFYNPQGVWKEKKGGYMSLNVAYRLKRPPERVSITSLTGTVEMKDGKPDWATYKE